MSDKSFGDYANRNIVKNPLLSTAVTGLSIEDLTHNAVLVPVAPNQGLITGSDQSGSFTQTLANTDHDITNFPSGDSNSNILLPPQPSISTHSNPVDIQTNKPHDGKPELLTSTVSKVSSKSEDDFDVNEYFARLQGTRYVSAPLHSHQDPNANLTETEENLEEINLNDDKGADIQQSLTADIAQNFSQLPNVLPHVASAVFSSFSNIWNMKSREQTPDDRVQRYRDLQYQKNQDLSQFPSNQDPQSYQDVHFHGTQHSGSNQFQESHGLSASVPLMSTEDVVKEVAPPPKEPPVSGTSNFRLQSKKKYAQIPGLSTGESKPIAFNPLTQNVPSYFIPTAVTQEENKQTLPQEPINIPFEQKPDSIKEQYNIFSPADSDTITGASDFQPKVPIIPTETQPKLIEERPPPNSINLQNQMPVIPPPPMFSTTRRDSNPGKSVLPPSVARRIGSNHPVIKQTLVNQPTVTGQIFVPTFDSTPTPDTLETNVVPIGDTTSQVPTYSTQMFTPSINQAPKPHIPVNLQPKAPPQIPHSAPLPGPPLKSCLPSSSQIPMSSIPGPPMTNVLNTEKSPPTAPSIFNPASQSTTPAIFTPGIPEPASQSGIQHQISSAIYSSQGPTSLTPLSNIICPPTSVSHSTLPPGPTPPTIGSAANIVPTFFTPQNASNIPSPLSESFTTFVPSQEQPLPAKEHVGQLGSAPQNQPTLFTPQKSNAPTVQSVQQAEPTAEPPKRLIEPPKAIGASNFRMTKKRPQYYSGPIEGIGSISNSIKPVIPTVDSGTFQGALFTPEQPQTESNVSSFDITKPVETTSSHPAYDISKQTIFNLNPTPYSSQHTSHPTLDMTQTAQDYGQQYNTAFDLSRPTTESYEPKEEPRESKGLGIIGSLKSKLSSIDINKIQNSVTTFFDPAYNEPTKDEPATQENVPYAQQYQGQTQNNFEIFVPNYEQSQPYSFNYQGGQSDYGQVTQGFQAEYNYQIQNIPYPGPNMANEVYSTSYYSEPTQSVNQYQMADIHSQETTTNIAASNPPLSGDNIAKNPTDADTKNTESADIPPQISQTYSVKEPKADAAGFNENEFHLNARTKEDQTPNVLTSVTQSSVDTNKSINVVNEILGTMAGIDLHHDYAQDVMPTPPTQLTYKAEEEMIRNHGIFPASEVIEKFVMLSEPSATVLFDNNNKSNVLSCFEMQKIGTLRDTELENKNKETKSVDLFTKTQRDIAKNGDIPKNDNLLESLSKGEMPILGVSSVPLFGLSTIMTETESDKINLPLYDKVKSIDMLDRNASMSFFENFGTMTQEPHDAIENKVHSNSSLSFFKNDYLGPDLGLQDTQVPSVSFFSNDQNSGECDSVKTGSVAIDRNCSLFENIGAVSNIEEYGLKDKVVLESKENNITEEVENVTELNICETCREVNKLEDREIEREDLTTQLIENITSPVLLSNAVEVPLTEDNNSQRAEIDGGQFEAGQFEEISHITEETIETIHVQSATELLEDESIKMKNYGWSVDESFVTNPPKHGDFNYNVEPSSISFFGDSLFRDNAPTNASDEIKAEFKQQKDLLPRQMSIPSAPPADEDSKSDEGGVLDVHSIELDAKEDFPIYEEFVIEPSETDDDKIEGKEKEQTEERNLDSFTNRVEKYKKMEEVTDVDELKSMPALFKMSSPPISMASYFDTGNYAADTHYKNTINSLSNISIPPGFEEEFKKRLALAKAREGLKTVPETSTQTRTTISVSYSTANTFSTSHSGMPVGFNVEANVSNIVEDNTDNLPETSVIFGSGSTKMKGPINYGIVPKLTEDTEEKLPALTTFEIAGTKIPKAPSNFRSLSDIIQDKTETLPQGTSMFAFDGDRIPETLTNFVNAFKTDEDTCMKLAQSSSKFAFGGDKLPEALTNFGNDSKTNEDTTEILAQNSSMLAFGDTKVPKESVNYGNASSIVEDSLEKLALASSMFAFSGENDEPIGFGNGSNKFEDDSQKLAQASSMFGFGSTKMPEVPTNFSKVSNIVDNKPEKLQPVSSIFGLKKLPEAPPSLIPAAKAEASDLLSIHPEETKSEAKTISFGGEKMPEASSIFNLGEAAKPGPSSISNFGMIAPPVTDKNPDAPKLPDPINFFADTPAAAPTENFSRLASYFSTPPKTEHAKSFFELSQSQNHYRHPIDQDKMYDLMKDLTSVQNLAVPTDQTIRHVNYFTVEYDTVSPKYSEGDNSKDVLENDDKDLDSLSTCRFCTKLIYDKSYKVKTAVNGNTEGTSTVPNMENANTGNRNSMSSILNFEGIQAGEETNEGVAGMTENRSNTEYAPVKHHWFYRVDVEEKSIWRGFSMTDSKALEEAFVSSDLNENTLVATDGGRFDVNVVGRLRIPVYWNDKPTNVRRCSWFYKGTTDPRYVPYTEPVADKLEVEYRHGMTTGEWHRRLVLPNGEVVVMHGPNVMVHFICSDGFSTAPLFSFGKRVYRNPPQIRVPRDQPAKIDHLIFMVHGAGEYRIQKEKRAACCKQSGSRPRVVRRGHDESEIEDPEPSSIDHLLLLCHGVGSACDMRFRSVEEVVEDFRSTSLQLVQSHYKNSYDQGIVSRVEVLPISWHATLHSGETGVDRRLSQITLNSIPRLRNFTNDTVLDVLFYTSPVFCQTILDTVCRELNRIYKLFVQRNPTFKGGVSLGGHSLGSVILYDLLCHQAPEAASSCATSPQKSYVNGTAGTGQPCVLYPSLQFKPAALYALGSPIAIFECIRGVESLGVDFKLPTCKNFFNIFHPYDPIAYRIEPLINPLLRDLKPYLIPHHKGRKRMHLELKDTMVRVGADLKQKLLESLRSTWNKWKAMPPDTALERVVEEEIEKEPLSEENKEDSQKEKELSTPAMLGRLNNGRRVDYVLQEAPLEMINEYLFAMSSHVGYWESEDTMLLMLREIYSELGIQPDSTVPQQSMTVQRTRMSDTKILVNAECPSTSGHSP